MSMGRQSGECIYLRHATLKSALCRYRRYQHVHRVRVRKLNVIQTLTVHFQNFINSSLL